jgi:hypothetical protein
MKTNTVMSAIKTYRKGPFLYWYKRSLKLWFCIQKDSEGIQIGKAGYGPTKEEAIEDCIYVNQ